MTTKGSPLGPMFRKNVNYRFSELNRQKEIILGEKGEKKEKLYNSRKREQPDTKVKARYSISQHSLQLEVIT